MTTTSDAETATRSALAGAPGRLGDPERDLASDPRADPRMVAALAPFGLDKAAAAPPLGPDAPLEARLEFTTASEDGFEAVFAALLSGLPDLPVEHSTETITGVDGNEITLYISRPAGATGPLPGILHIHGGGMVILHASGPAYVRFRAELAATGLVVVGAEYRNGGGALGPHPFPAGLNDNTSALQWVHEHRAELGISSITVAGESGGGNLTLATALKAKQDGHLDMIDGVYAMVPYVSGVYGDAAAFAKELPSLVENNTYFLHNDGCAVLASVYAPDGTHDRDPLAWPHWATVEDVTGLPPHVISVCELDPLRDEGLAYYRKLLAAGVPANGRVVLGMCHAGDLMFRGQAPEIYLSTIRDISSFAKRDG
jgi:acetyl esterase